VSSCAFPFKYNGKLYDECISSSEGRISPWCSTTFDYDQDKRWGYCVDVKCFKLFDDEKMNFMEARNACQSDGGFLASIGNELEQCKL
jgi:hypothetical protein